ncbi:MAG TPA: sugar nucleotidyltransferase, partial [Candidatus Poseidoniales archaeon]|nr:sugar nucleotidyltransferase [Candidatus Poseidoniales archaeon]
MEMKAVLVAGGRGSRLFPFTRYTHKTLLPLHRRPVIDYALATIRRAGIKDITIIGNQFIGQIAQHVGTGLEGENIHYVIEEEPKGVHHALNLARPHVEGSRILIYFSDNIVTYELDKDVQHWKDSPDPPGCLLLGRTVPDPERFGVAIFGDDGEIIDIVEKPVDPPSAVAIGGIYLYDEKFWDIMDE